MRQLIAWSTSSVARPPSPVCRRRLDTAEQPAEPVTGDDRYVTPHVPAQAIGRSASRVEAKAKVRMASKMSSTRAGR